MDLHSWIFIQKAVKVKLFKKIEDNIFFLLENLIHMNVSEGVWGSHISIKWCLYTWYK